MADGSQSRAAALTTVSSRPSGVTGGILGRVVVITGASSGIGRCTAALFARQGWDVGLIARGAEGLCSLQSELAAHGTHAAAAADVADAAALEQATAALERELGPIDVWVNCAGNGVYGAFLDVPEDEFRRVTDVTYMGTVNGTRVALRRMVPRGRGVVVNVCSAMVFGSLPALSSYAGAKAAIRAFSDSVRHELEEARSPVRLTVIFPPAVNTPFFSHAPSYMPLPPRPAKPVYQPDIVADAILLAATTPRREIEVSGITVVFALASRLLPGTVRWAIGRLGAERQTTGDPEVQRLHAPTLHAPSGLSSCVYGPFGRGSRAFSTQMWLNRRRGVVAGVAAAAVGLLAVLAMQ